MLTECALCGGDAEPQKVEKVIRVEKDVVFVPVDAEKFNLVKLGIRKG